LILRHFLLVLSHMQDLFRKVLPQQCLGSVWSRRASASSRQNGRVGQSSPGCAGSADETVATVSATVDQFNAVTHRVIASVVDTTLSPLSSSSAAATSSVSVRARVVEKWIDVAQVCSLLALALVNESSQ